MRINDDFSQPVTVHASKMDWVPSPSPGVDRRMLFRIGGEVARATSIVRYAPGSAFPRHMHTGGEEILVLDGTFQDEHGDYPAGSYFRNPPGTSHVPAAKEGCTIFVRLWQFRADDHSPTVVRPGKGNKVQSRPGAASTIVLFDDGHELVSLEDWQPGATFRRTNPRGLELFVVSGALTLNGELLAPQSWVRLPADFSLTAEVGTEGAKVWLKDAPLLHSDVIALPG